MVDATDLKFYKSKDAGLGGDIDTDLLITSSTFENLINGATRAEQVAGEDFYACMYMKNTHATERMGNVSFWQTRDTINADTTVKWATEAVPHEYFYAPWEDFNGTSDFVEQAHSASLNLNHFTVAVWFNTSKSNYTTEGFIVNKGGFGSESAGQNLNYGIWIDTTEKIQGGFEESDGTNHFATSVLNYNDGLWHFAVCTYNGTEVVLYIDGAFIASHATSATPDTGTNALRIGKNSRADDSYFEGKIDEVRVYNDALLSDEINDLFDEGTLPSPEGLVYENKFGADIGTRIAQRISTQYIAPAGLTWQSVSSEPTESNYGTLSAGEYKPIWIWFHVEPNAEEVRGAKGIFSFALDIHSTGTGSGGQTGGGGGGGSGGNPIPTPTNWKIAAVGDWGEENETDDVVDYIVDNDYDLVIGTGDNSYTSSDNEWYAGVIKPIDDNQGSDVRFESATGNHDSASSIKSHFHVNNTYYSFDFENVHVLILDTESNMEGSQLTFATNDLEKQLSRTNIDWIFVAFHRPMVTASTDHPGNEEDQIQNYMNLFLESGVSLVLTGHNHVWERTYPIKRNGSSVSRVITDSNGPYVKQQPAPWLIHVVTGTGGHDTGDSLYDLGSQPSYSAYQNNTHNGIFSIEASNGGQTLTCRFRDTSGQTFDTFTMTQE